MFINFPRWEKKLFIWKLRLSMRGNKDFFIRKKNKCGKKIDIKKN